MGKVFDMCLITGGCNSFGGDGNSITIMGQSGGGLGIASQMILYDGKKPNFNRACARSIQRSAQFAVGDMRVSTHED